MPHIASTPYPWPFDGALRPDNTALIVIDMQTDFCGIGGYVDKMGYDLSMTRAPIAPLQRLMAGMRAQPPLPRQVAARETGHGAEHQHAFQAQVDAARLFGDALAQADEEKRRADADGPAQHGQQHVQESRVAHATPKTLRVVPPRGNSRLAKPAPLMPAPPRHRHRPAACAARTVGPACRARPRWPG